MVTAKKSTPVPAKKTTPPARKAAPSAKQAVPAPKPAAKKTAPRNSAVALLTKDHRDVKKLFNGYQRLIKSKAAGPEKQEVARQICEMLTAHARIEEEIFYPAMREGLDAADLLDEAEVEHASAKDLIAQLGAMGPDDALYDAKVTVLGEYIDHHVEEEEGEMFPKAEKAKLDLLELGARLRARKAELLEQAATADSAEA